MAKHLLENAGAEKEANDIGMYYMNSSDVLGDMRRDYGSALDGVRIHDDAAAEAKVSGIGRDGLATGKDVYMRSGSLSSSDPAVKGLLAHEIAHTMQQSSGETSGRVEYGAEQGGFLDFFKRIFSRKKKEEPQMQISEPSLIKMRSVSPDAFAAAPDAAAKRSLVSQTMFNWGKEDYLGDEEGVLAALPSEDELRSRYEGRDDFSVGDDGRYWLGQSGKRKSYATMQALHLADSIKGMSTEEIRANPLLQKQMQLLFNRDMADRLPTSRKEDGSVDYAKIMRDNNNGELAGINRVLEALLPKDFMSDVITRNVGEGKTKAQNLSQIGSFYDKRKDLYTKGQLDKSISLTVPKAVTGIGNDIAAEMEGSDYGEYLLGAHKAYAANDLSPEEFSTSMMSNALLRGMKSGEFTQAHATDPEMRKAFSTMQAVFNDSMGSEQLAEKYSFSKVVARMLRRR